MAQKLIFLDYTFLFDTNTTFSHLYEFEKVLSDFLATRGFEAEVVKTIEGSPGKRILLISKKEVVQGMSEKNPVGRPQTLKGKIQELSDRKLRKPAIDFMKGKK